MSALGQKQTSRWVRVMSALPPKADIQRRRDVCFVPKADKVQRSKELSLFEARSCVDELGHPSKLPLRLEAQPGNAGCE